MPIATGAVTDFDASERSTSSGRPRPPPITTALPPAAKPPSSAARANARPRRRTSARRCHSGQASATTAGPSSTWTNCAPAKYVGYGVPLATSAAPRHSTDHSTGFAHGARPSRS